MNQLAVISQPWTDPDYADESAGARAEVKSWWPLMEEIRNAAVRKNAIAQIARQIGEPYKTVERKFYAFKNSGWKWAALINRAKFPARRRSTLPVAFVQYWRDLYLTNQRATSGKAMYDLLLAKLEVWEADPLNREKMIPGYVRPPKRQRQSRLPAGWSYETLMRLLPNKCTRTMIRQGPKAASEYFPNIPTTRVGLDIGQYLYFDDSLHDFSFNLTGVNGKALRPLSFNSMEALSGSFPEILLKPQIEGPNGRLELNQLDFFWFVILVLTKHGYNAETGTTLVFEWRTANVDKDSEFDERIGQVTGGKVTVDRSGKFGDPLFKSLLFGGQPSGNFRFKAPLESLFNAVRNRTGFLPAQTGRNPDVAPEENYGLHQYNERILRLVDKLPAHIATRLQSPVKEWEDVAMAIRIVHDWIDLRRDHKLQGWAKLGFKGRRYRLSLDREDWIGEREYLALPLEQRNILDQIVSKPGYFDSFDLSPREVFQSLCHRLTKLPLSVIPILAPDRAWKPFTVSPAFEIEINDPFVDSDPLVYWAKLTNAHGHEVHLQRGKKYLYLLNPFEPSRIWIAEADGSRRGTVIGTTDRINPSTRADSDDLIRLMAEHNHIRSNHSKEAVVHMAPEARRRVEMKEHNQRVLGKQPVTEEEKRQANTLKQAGRRKIDKETMLNALATDGQEETAEPLFTPDDITRLFSSEN